MGTEEIQGLSEGSQTVGEKTGIEGIYGVSEGTERMQGIPEGTGAV